MFSKHIQRDDDSGKKDYIKIAYRTNKSFDTVKNTNTNLFAFFPTKVQTGLSFICQGPFDLTTNPEGLLENNSKKNEHTDN